MTPETARALEPGTTPGPWKLLYRSEHPNAAPDNVVMGRDEVELANDGHGYDPEWTNPAGDLPLIAAAPDMRATIAALEWEYQVQTQSRAGTWINATPEEPWMDEVTARWVMEAYTPSRARLVRRPVGPVEVVE